jgi:hypothetical protein
MFKNGATARPLDLVDQCDGFTIEFIGDLPRKLRKELVEHLKIVLNDTCRYHGHVLYFC